MSKVQITCETENANIYYTLNGENPTSNSALYSSPFEVNKTCTVKAIGYKEGYLESDVLEKDLIKLPTPNLGSDVTTEAGNIMIDNIDEYASLELNQMTVVFSFDSDMATTYKEKVFNSFTAGFGNTDINIQDTLEYNQSIYARVIAEEFLDSDIAFFTRRSTIN